MGKSMKYFGFYRGVVMQCLNNGFCRIQIPGILEAINGDVNTLPLAEPAQSLGGGGIDTSNGDFVYPDLKSIVWCFFEGGKLERPVYFATSFVKSSMWNNVNTPTPRNMNKGNDGYTVKPTGKLSQYNKTSIKQEIILDEKVNKPVGDKIDIKVESTSEQDKMRNKTAIDTANSTGGPSSPTAACVHLDNKNNIVHISAKNEIHLKAPKIIFDTTGFEVPGYILLQSNEIDNNTFSGNFRVMTSGVNIDGGINDIILQTLGNIWLLKNTGSSASDLESATNDADKDQLQDSNIYVTTQSDNYKE